MNKSIIALGKLISYTSRGLNLGHGSTWPGHLALAINKKFISESLKNTEMKTVLVTGTNGKTTTAKMIETILKQNGKSVFINESGANLLNGIASAIIINSYKLGGLNYDYAIFEVDENNLSLIASQFEPEYIIALNLFRDQLDRYGEIDSIIKKWRGVYKLLDRTKFILNADDPQISYLGNNIKDRVYYFGLETSQSSRKDHEHASDSIFCPKCGEKLEFEAYYFSHLGRWNCPKCGLKRPKPNLDSFSYFPALGTYTKYDTLAAVLFSELIGISSSEIENALKTFKPAFGRQEIIEYKNKKLKLFLSKNPTSFNESLRTIGDENPKNLLIALNDRVPDGRDISWIWDVDFEELVRKNMKLYLTGERVFDLALRLKYADINLSKKYVLEDLNEAIERSVADTNEDETLYILPTYSSMLEIRKLITGRKIL